MSKIDTYLQKVVRVIKVDNAHNDQLTPQSHMSDDLNTHVLSTFDAVIFDFDGTLLDSLSVWDDIQNKLFRLRVKC